MTTTISRANCLEQYARLGWNVGSADLHWDGGKVLKPHSKFDDRLPKTLRADASAFIVYTGKLSNVCVIDLDDLERAEQKHLEALMVDCNAVQRTRKGRHYFYKWDARITSAVSATHKIDTKSAGGCILCYPTAYMIPDVGVVEYTWERFPSGSEVLGVCPEPVIAYLTTLGLVTPTPIKRKKRTPAATDPRINPDRDAKMRSILEALPVSRWDSYADWITIGMACFNEGCSVALWDEFSKRGSTYVAGECAVKWLSFRKDADRKVTSRRLMEWIDIIDDVFACRKFIALMADSIHREDDAVFVFDPATGLWDSSEIALYAAVHRHKAALIFHTVGDTGMKTTLNYGGSTRHIKNMLFHLKSLLPNEQFIQRNIEASLPYLLFSDGIFHIPTGVFTAGFDKARVFTARIARPFPFVRDRALEADINRRLFVEPLQTAEVGRYLKMRLARSIAGCYRDKKFVCCIGEADSSKGTITCAMRAAFGGYVVEWDANHLKYNSRSGADEAKKLSWVFPMRDARLAISNECRMDKVPIDGNLLKSLSSGGDVISARQNFKDEVPLVLRSSFIYMGNDMPEITPKDSGIKTRVRVVRFTKRFVETPVLPTELLADPTIKTRLSSDVAWQNAVFWLIVDSYGSSMSEPAEVVEETNEWIPVDCNKFREVLEEEFVLNVGDGAEDNFVAAKDIIAYVRSQDMNMSDTKIGRELGKLGLERTIKKVSGKAVGVWKGIKKT